MKPNDTDIAHIFGGRTWAQHNKLRGPSGKDVRTRPCMCINAGCKERWIECWGEVNAPHLKRVGSAKEVAKCGMTPAHAGAQSIVAALLGSGKELVFKRECITCGDVCVNKVRLSSEEECRPEAFFHTERRNFADLGILPKGAKSGTRPTKIIEILQSSATSEEHRPQDIPWFEIKAKHVNEHKALQATDPLLEFGFDCQRKIECNQCVKIGPFFDWIRAQDKGTPRDMWNRQYYHKCIMCESFCEHTHQMDPALYTFRSERMLYARHRMCVNHSKLMAVCTTVPSEFFADARVLYGKRCEQFEEAKRIEAANKKIKRIEAEFVRAINEATRAADQAADQSAHIERIEDAKRAANIKRIEDAKRAAEEVLQETTRKRQGGKRQRTRQGGAGSNRSGKQVNRPRWKQRWYGAYEEQARSLAIKQYNDSSRTQSLDEYLLNYEFTVE